MIKSCKLLTVNYLCVHNPLLELQELLQSVILYSIVKCFKILHEEDKDHTHQIIYNHFSLGSRPKTNPSADHFQYRPRRYTGTDIRARWGTSMDETTIILTQQNLQQATAKARAP